MTWAEAESACADLNGHLVNPYDEIDVNLETDFIIASE